MTHASVFSGIGGPEIAATMLGWDNVFHCEINDFGRKILDYWYPNSKSYEDITKTDFSEWRGKVDVLTGGFPCQPFSYAGKRRGADDDRYLWPFMFKAIDQIRPTWIVAENVAGITTMVEQGEVSEVGGQASIFEEVDGLRRYRLAETFTLQRICDDLEGHGYSVQPVLVPACAVGAPHRRDRVFIVARRVTTDSNCSYDRGNAGENDGKSKKERIQKRNEIRIVGESDKVRSEMCNFVADTDSRRVQGFYSDGELCEQRNNKEFVKNCGRYALSDTSCSGKGTLGESGCSERERRRDDDEQEERREPSEWSYGFYELLRHPSDTNGSLLQRWDCERPSDSKPGCRAKSFYSQKIQKRWDSFPTVSPVHRGNDGIPFDVDGLAISFSKWRTESLKAYGNAIVPQVMYEIFRAIDLIEKSRH